TLAEFPLTVADVEQGVIRGRLILGVLLAYSEGADIGRVWNAAERVANDLDMEVELSTGRNKRMPKRSGRLHVTVLGAPLKPAAMAGIAGRISAHGANIDRIERLAQNPVTCIEMDVSGADPDALRAALTAGAAASARARGRVRRLRAGPAACLDGAAKGPEAARRGELDFEGALRERVALLAGLDAPAIDEVRGKLKLAAGARTMVRTLKRLDYKFAIVSGGFTQVTDALVEDLGIDYSSANTLEIENGKITGRVHGPVIDRAGKAEALRRFAREAGVPLSQTVAIGDGANDLDMPQAAGLGIAYHAKPVVPAAADTAVNVPYLDTIVFLLGISREEVEAADALDLQADEAPAASWPAESGIARPGAAGAAGSVTRRGPG